MSNKPTVQLLHHTPLHIASHAIRKCWASGDKSDTFIDDRPASINRDGVVVCGPKDRELIERVGNKFKHASTLEHISYSFDISEVSRALLQELARHRIASPSVKSTRYTLKELKEEDAFVMYSDDRFTASYDMERASKYLVYTGDSVVDQQSCLALEGLRTVLAIGVSNDKAKYCLPESYKTGLAWTINARSLQNFLALRSAKAALWEIRDLANAIFDALPEDHKYLFEGCMAAESE